MDWMDALAAPGGNSLEGTHGAVGFSRTTRVDLRFGEERSTN